MLIKAKGDYINGKFVRARRPDGEIPSVDPGDSEVIIGDFPVRSAALDEALVAARLSQPAWAALPQSSRVGALQKLRAELRNRTDDLVGMLTAETGKPLWEARQEVLAMHLELDSVLQHGLSELALCQPPPGESRVDFVPLGVIAVISPYTEPALLMHADAVAAMATGCTTVCKPAAQAPGVGQLYAEIVHEADLPRGVFNLVLGDAAAGEVLATSALCDGVLFAGSVARGQQLRQRLTASAPGKMLRASLSGHAAVLVLDDANIEEAAYATVIGSCIGAGQRCTSTRRVIVHRRVAGEVIERLGALIAGMRIGYGKDPETFMGPLISTQAVDDYLGEIKRLAAGGAVELVRGAPLTSRQRGFYVSPALLRLEPEQMATLCDREAAGPVIALSEVNDLEEGLALVNRSPFGLVAGVFGRSPRDLEHARQKIDCGLVLLNQPTTNRLHRVPTAPLGRSGNGVPGGTLTARVCTRPRVSVAAEGRLDVTALPPGLPRAV